MIKRYLQAAALRGAAIPTVRPAAAASTPVNCAIPASMRIFDAPSAHHRPTFSAPSTPIDEALVERVRDRIVEACHPKALYLFGSAARGETREGSDLDPLVVMDLPEGVRSYDVATELHGLFGGWLVPLDIIVRTPEQFQRGQRMLGFVERTAVREGRLLHDVERDHV